MKISLNWLRQYVNIDLSIDDLVKGFTYLGIEVESVENQAAKLNKFVIGKVIERQKHPNADKLSVCKVDAGTGEILNIVCGAPNVDSGQTVCVALVGAVIPNGEFEIKKAKLRGELSEGMICSAKELNLGDDHSGIMVLETDLPVGTPFAEYLKQNDVIIDISITPNRGDLLSHLGIALETGALTGNRVNEPAVTELSTGGEISKRIKVEISDSDACVRYCGTMVENITVKESPDWLKNYLSSCGLRPINNIVDVSNYVMMECGQPLHAFDYDMISGKKIIVKRAGGVKKFITLDGKERDLRDEILLISDAERPVALAGIMGGANSEISNSTKNVFIESAYFNPVLTRKSSKFLGLQSDSSYRFERGVDIDKTRWAALRAAELIAELGGGKIVDGLIDEYPNKLTKLIVGIRLDYLGRISGAEYSAEKVTELLGKIGINFKEEKNGIMYFEIPQSRREDLTREIDLIEEVVRLDGYDKIGEPDHESLKFEISDFYDKEYDFVMKARNYLVGRGFHEILSNSLVEEKLVNEFGEDYVSLVNPSNDQMTVLRTNLHLGMLEVVKMNFEHMNDSLKFFEVGNVFNYSKEGEIVENKSILLTLAGNYDVESADTRPRYFDILDIKAEVKGLLEKLNVEFYNINYYNYTGNIDFQLNYDVKGISAAVVSKFSERFLKKLNIDKPVLICEIPCLV